MGRWVDTDEFFDDTIVQWSLKKRYFRYAVGNTRVSRASLCKVLGMV